MMNALDYSSFPKKYLWPRSPVDWLKMESQKTFMGSEVNYINICTLRQTRLHSVDAQLSVESWHSKGDMSTLKYKRSDRKL